MTRAASDNSLGSAVEVLPRESPRGGAMSPTDLAELLAAFNDVTSKLQSSHEKLHGEVARLSGELADANALLERTRRLAALGEMAAGIAHEVRNPLGSIRLYARMLEQDLPIESESRGVALKIAKSVTAIEHIVGDVLSFAREHRLQRSEVDVVELVERSLEACAPQGHPAWQGILIERQASPAGSVTIEADSGLVQQALVNVIRNAFEAMEESAAPEGGHRLVIVVERRNEIDGRAMDAVAIVVRDTGPGVTPEVIARMFNPFFTTRSAGTGLGLSIVHRIVDAHSGMIRVRHNRDVAGSEGLKAVARMSSDGAPQCGSAGFDRGACVELVLPAVGSEADAAVGLAVREVMSRAAEGVRIPM